MDNINGENGYVEKIRSCLYNTAAGAVRLGFYLREVREFKIYEESESFKNFVPKQYATKKGIIRFTKYGFYEFCSEYFNLSRRTVDRYIDISLAYCHHNEMMPTYFIDSKYKDYSVAALAEMLQLDEKKRDEVTSEMTVKEIRDLKKADAVDEENVHNEECESDKCESFDNVLMPDQVDYEDVKLINKYKYKKKHYSLSHDLDLFVDSNASYTSAFSKVRNYLGKGYLVRIVLYAPGSEDDKSIKL